MNLRELALNTINNHHRHKQPSKYRTTLVVLFSKYNWSLPWGPDKTNQGYTHYHSSTTLISFYIKIEEHGTNAYAKTITKGFVDGGESISSL